MTLKCNISMVEGKQCVTVKYSLHWTVIRSQLQIGPDMEEQEVLCNIVTTWLELTTQ